MDKVKPHKRIFVILIQLILLLIVIGLIIWVLFGGNMNSQAVEQVPSLMAQQAEKEQEFKIDGYDINNPNVILNPYGNSPLTALVMFQTTGTVSPTVTIHGDDELTTFEHTFDATTNHYLPIYGLYADRDNLVTIEYEENGTKISKDLTIKTGALPDNMVRPIDITSDKNKLTNDLYFFTPSSQGYTMAYDVNGNVRWYLTNNALWKIDRLDNGHLLISTERRVNSPYYMTGLYEMDLMGKIYAEFDLPGGYHHDYYEMPDGNLLVASNDFTSGDGTVEDVIVELDRQTGDIVRQFDLKNILDTDDGKSENWSSYDWFHNNSVWYDQTTNTVILSGRHKDAVIGLDYNSGDLKWIIGDPTNWDEEYQQYFFTPIGSNFEWQWSQHAAMVTPEGYIFILDNGNNKSKNADSYVPASQSYTRGVMYKIDTDNMTIEQVWQYGKERGSEFYSPYISDVDYLGENHYIVHSGGIVSVDGQPSNQPAGLSTGNIQLASDTVELLDDEVIFEIKLPTNNYRVEKMNPYADNGNFSLGISKQLGSLGETKPDEVKTSLIFTGKQLDDNYLSRNISLKQEEDRLVFEGQFKRGQTVNVILRQGVKSYYYNVKVSKKPYTALCVDVFTDEENENGIVVTKYINQEGLSGRYCIYIEIDGVIYNTGKYVKF